MTTYGCERREVCVIIYTLWETITSDLSGGNRTYEFAVEMQAVETDRK